MPHQRVLVADDDPSIRQLLELTLRSDGYDVICASNGHELLARVKSHLRRSAQRPVLTPLSGAPGGVLFSQELRHRLARGAPLALLYADLDNFKAFNDAYGFSRGDRAILLLAGIIQNIL